MQENKQLKPSTEEPSRRHRPFYKHPLFLATIIILVIAGTVFAVLHFTKKPATPATSTVTTSIEEAKPTQTPTNTTEETKENTADVENDSSSVSPDGKTPAQYDGADPNQGGTLTGSITAARFDGNKLLVRVNIDQYLSSGTCSLIITNGANQLQKSANLIPSVATSTCEGFDIDSAELANFARPLNITINLTSGDKTGTITGVVE
ncbi:hypothetical protein IIZ77_02020 [Candidatus Saccharibacteria bacterium]|nr:hypothetical protein [Candidatus Saccharibacteria bacterium]